MHASLEGADLFAPGARPARVGRHHDEAESVITTRAVKMRAHVAWLQVMGTITQVWTRDPIAALTFDDGPHPVWTPRLLDILHAYDARASFFMIGKTAQRYRTIVQRVAAEKHAIGNHSWDHPSFPLITGSERREQIRACGRAIAPYGCGLFRPPYGHQTFSSRMDALWLRQRVVTWSVAARDWLDDGPKAIVERVLSQVRPGSVILFHDALADAINDRCFDREPTLQAVSILLERLAHKLTLVTLPELLRHGKPLVENWVIRSDRASLNQLRPESGEPRRYGIERRRI
jgi:peptidoglycan-N-acetylglucosamine deacetylase